MSYNLTSDTASMSSNMISTLGNSESLISQLMSLRADRGECETCGVQTHKIKRTIRGRSKKPLTIEGVVLHGRCLLCHPLNETYQSPPSVIDTTHKREPSNMTLSTNPFDELNDYNNTEYREKETLVAAGSCEDIAEISNENGTDTEYEASLYENNNEIDGEHVSNTAVKVHSCEDNNKIRNNNSYEENECMDTSKEQKIPLSKEDQEDENTKFSDSTETKSLLDDLENVQLSRDESSNSECLSPKTLSFPSGDVTDGNENESKSCINSNSEDSVLSSGTKTSNPFDEDHDTNPFNERKEDDLSRCDKMNNSDRFEQRDDVVSIEISEDLFFMEEIQSPNTSISRTIEIMSDHPDNVSIQNIGCRRIKYLARSISNKRAVMACGGVPVILSAIEHFSNNEQLQTTKCAFAALCSLTSRNDVNKSEIGKSKLIPSIMKVMANHSDVEFVQEEGCNALLDLTFCPSHLFQLKAMTDEPAGIDAVLRNASRRFPGKCHSVCCVVLEKLNPNENEALDLIRSSDADFDDVLNIMKAFRTAGSVQNVGCVRLEIMTRKDDTDVNDSVVISLVLDAMVEHEGLFSLQALGASILTNLCQKCHSSGGDANIDLILESGAVALVLTSMQRFQKVESVQMEGCILLCHLARISVIGLDIVMEERPKKILKAAGKHFPEKCGMLSEEILQLISHRKVQMNGGKKPLKMKTMMKKPLTILKKKQHVHEKKVI